MPPELLPLLRADIPLWLMGGWATELLTAQVRSHDDIDFFVALRGVPKLAPLLSELGFDLVHGSLADDAFYKKGDPLLNLTPIDDSVSPPRTLGSLAGIVWPADLLTGQMIDWDGLPVRTLTPAALIAMKRCISEFYNVSLREKDEWDVAALEALIRIPLNSRTVGKAARPDRCRSGQDAPPARPYRRTRIFSYSRWSDQTRISYGIQSESV